MRSADYYSVRNSKSFTDMLALAKRMASAVSEPNILLKGKRGTGKTLLAEFIHEHSRRKAKKLVVLDLARVTESVAESDLFGVVKGTFTGQEGKRPGKFGVAHESTLFLDELGKASNRLQDMLHNVLTDLPEGKTKRVYTPMGTEKRVQTDVRLIAAIQLDQIDQLMPSLFDRLAQNVITLPTLRDCREDILPLVDFYFRKELGHQGASVELADDANRFLRDEYDWEGDARFLEDVVSNTAPRLALTPGNLVTPQVIVVTRQIIEDVIRELEQATPHMDSEAPGRIDLTSFGDAFDGPENPYCPKNPSATSRDIAALLHAIDVHYQSEARDLREEVAVIVAKLGKKDSANPSVDLRRLCKKCFARFRDLEASFPKLRDLVHREMPKLAVGLTKSASQAISMFHSAIGIRAYGRAWSYLSHDLQQRMWEGSVALFEKSFPETLLVKNVKLTEIRRSQWSAQYLVYCEASIDVADISALQALGGVVLGHAESVAGAVTQLRSELYELAADTHAVDRVKVKDLLRDPGRFLVLGKLQASKQELERRGVEVRTQTIYAVYRCTCVLIERTWYIDSLEDCQLDSLVRGVAPVPSAVVLSHEDARDSDCYQDYLIDRVNDTNPSPVSYTWADAVTHSSIRASLIAADPPHLKIWFNNRGGGWPGNVAIHPIGGAAIRSHGKRALAFEARALEPGNDPGVTRGAICLSVRVLDGRRQNWVLGPGPGRYRQFPVSCEWTVVEVPLDPRQWWPFDRHILNSAPDLSTIGLLVLEVGRRKGSASDRLSDGTGTILVRKVSIVP